MARNTASGLADVAGETGKPIVCVARTPVSEQGMGATLVFQEAAAERGLGTFSSVAAASLALQRMLAWQSLREPVFAAK